jgi:hypothetical protein
VARPDPPSEHRWKPGQSGNAAGYSRGRRISDALSRLIEAKGAADLLAEVWLAKSLEGDPKFFAMLLDRTEGRVAEAREEPVGLADVHDRMTEYLDPDGGDNPSGDDGSGPGVVPPPAEPV